MKNLPQVIWLQVAGEDYGEGVTPDDDFNELCEGAITWCSDQINSSDIRYILAPEEDIKQNFTKPEEYDE